MTEELNNELGIDNNYQRQSYIEDDESMNDIVIQEMDIFKYLVRREDINVRDTKEALKMFFNRLPINIFKDEYYLLYNVMEYAHKYNSTFNEFQLYDILMNNRDSIIMDNNISLHKNVIDATERLELIYLSVQNTIDDLKLEETEGDISNMMLSLKLYIDKYVESKLQAVSVRYAKMLGGDILKSGNIKYTIEESTEVFEKAKKLLMGLLNEQVEMLSEEIDTGTMTVEDMYARFNDTTRLDLVSRFGVDDLDETVGGIKKSNYIAVQAGGGIGKSRFGVINIGYNSVMMGKNVLIDSLELKANQVFALFLARHILSKYGHIEGMDSNTIYTQENLTEEQHNYFNLAMVDLMTNADYGRILIRDEQIKADTLESSLERVWDSGFHFDLYCLDYIGLVAGSNYDRSKHETVTKVSNYLKTAVKNFKGVGFGLVVITQISKEGEDALNNGAESAKLYTAESNDIQRDCDIMVTIHATEEMKIENRMKLFVEKSRHVDVSGIRNINLETDLGRCFFQQVR